MQFACDQGDTFWGHYIVDNVALQIGLPNDDQRLAAAGLAEFAATVVATPMPDQSGFTLALQAVPQFLSRISAVHFQGKYHGYDENGNQYRTDWHGMTKGKQPYGVLASLHTPPFTAKWNTEMLPAQERVAVRAMIEFEDLPDTTYSTPSCADLAITKRIGEEVTIYEMAEQPAPFWSRSGRRIQSSIAIDIDPQEIISAELHVVAWTGGAGEISDYFQLNDRHYPIAEGERHELVYSVLPVDPATLRRGMNPIVLLSDTDHHGIEVMSPGPALVVRHRTGPTVRLTEAAVDKSADSLECYKIETQDSTSPAEPANDASKRLALQQFALTAQGSAEAGQRLFFQDQRTKCSTCHLIGTNGGEVGPDLSKIGGKFDRPHLIESLLEPSGRLSKATARPPWSPNPEPFIPASSSRVRKRTSR